MFFVNDLVQELTLIFYFEYTRFQDRFESKFNFYQLIPDDHCTFEEYPYTCSNQDQSEFSDASMFEEYTVGVI